MSDIIITMKYNSCVSLSMTTDTMTSEMSGYVLWV